MNFSRPPNPTFTTTDAQDVTRGGAAVASHSSAASGIALLSLIRRHISSLQWLSVLAAELRLQHKEPGGRCDPVVRRALRDVICSVEPSLLDDVDIAAQDADKVIDLIRYHLSEAVDLVSHSARASEWKREDALLINNIGRLSRLVVHGINSVAEEQSELKKLLHRPGGGVFLDVGVGSAWLAIEACRVWPDVSVVGLDVWQPALDIATHNVEAQGLTDRIQLRLQDVAETRPSDAGTVTIAWLPTMFIPEANLQAALLSIRAALHTGGWLILGSFLLPADAFGGAMTRLRTIKSGGRMWSDVELEAELTKTGYGHVRHALYESTRLTFVQRDPAQ